MIQSYSIERIKPHKQFAIWGMTGNRLYPLAYIQKQKWMTEEQYVALCKHIRLDAPKDFLEDK